MTQPVAPSIKETAFSCPHCGAYTTQYWHNLFAHTKSNETPLPFVPNAAYREQIVADHKIEKQVVENFLEFCDKMLTGLVFLDESPDPKYLRDEVRNLHLSKCYNCKKIAVWIHDRLLFPGQKISVAPNPDLPADIIRDFEEAREIADASPRGAAALLRLCIQKLCEHLGQKRKNIDEAIGNLVKEGLSPTVQKSLDILRVIGNEAVHPGTMDLKDDRDTAMRLFELLNAIADQMITHPRAVDSMYEKLPQTKRDAIEKRDGDA